jgi:hypothetical protein
MTLTLVPTILKSGARCCGEGDQQQLSPETAQQFTDDLLILAHPIRIQILTMLARSDGQVCVCDLEAALPVKQPTVSHHLRLYGTAALLRSVAVAAELRDVGLGHQLTRGAGSCPAARRDHSVPAH